MSATTTTVRLCQSTQLTLSWDNVPVRSLETLQGQGGFQPCLLDQATPEPDIKR